MEEGYHGFKAKRLTRAFSFSLITGKSVDTFNLSAAVCGGIFLVRIVPIIKLSHRKKRKQIHILSHA